MTDVDPHSEDRDPARPGRGPLRQLAEVRGWVGGFERDDRRILLRTEDGVTLVASYLPGPEVDSPAVALFHGFAAHRRKPAYAALADGLARSCHVLAVDLRGHGESAGRSTFGRVERHDVAAALHWLRTAGHRTVLAIGASMGGVAVLGEAANGTQADAIVTISTGAFHGRVRRPGIADLDEVLNDPVRRTLWQLVAGFRFAAPQALPSLDPVVLAVDVAVPTLVVHGEDDDYFPPSDADHLADAVGTGAVTWHEPPGFGHAETGFDAAFMRRLEAAIHTFARTGRFPERDEVTVTS